MKQYLIYFIFIQQPLKYIFKIQTNHYNRKKGTILK